MKTLAVFMMIILAVNVSYAVEPASVDATGVGMHDGAASTTATHCGARYIEAEAEDATVETNDVSSIDA
jgi:hypothetical protein